MNKQNMRDALEQLGDTETIRKELAKFRANIDFFEHIRGSLVEKHPNEWVAVQDKRVVATSQNLVELISVLKRAEVDTGTCFIQFLDPSPKPQILTIQKARVFLAFLHA